MVLLSIPFSTYVTFPDMQAVSSIGINAPPYHDLIADNKLVPLLFSPEGCGFHGFQT